MVDWVWVIIGMAGIFLSLGVWMLRKGCGQHNICDWGGSWLNRMDGLNRLFCYRYHRMSPVTLPLPERGGALVVANHISGLDPLLLIAASRRPLRFMIAREEYERFGLRWLFRAVGCIPVDRERGPERALRAALRALRKGEVVAIFPQGGIHASEVPTKLKAGVIYLAEKTHSEIYPIHIDGVRGRGFSLRAVFWRSRVQLRVFAALACVEHTDHQCLQRIAQALNKSMWEESALEGVAKKNSPAGGSGA